MWTRLSVLTYIRTYVIQCYPLNILSVSRSNSSLCHNFLARVYQYGIHILVYTHMCIVPTAKSVIQHVFFLHQYFPYVFGNTYWVQTYIHTTDVRTYVHTFHIVHTYVRTYFVNILHTGHRDVCMHVHKCVCIYMYVQYIRMYHI